MKIKVRIFGEDLTSIVGAKHEVELDEDATILTLTNLIASKTGVSRSGFLGPFKVGGADLSVMINGKNIALMDGLKTKLSKEDDIVIMPFVVGG